MQNLKINQKYLFDVQEATLRLAVFFHSLVYYLPVITLYLFVIKKALRVALAFAVFTQLSSLSHM